jgi:hypothetical protein
LVSELIRLIGRFQPYAINTRMKQFKPTYLYVKTHNVTGLKYFGKTTSNRKSYKGSGHYWTRHIKKHGYDVTTEILGYFTDPEECFKFATAFSNANNIVESSEWANERIENGFDGGDTTSSKSPAEIETIVAKRKETMEKKTAAELFDIKKKNSKGVKRYIKENTDRRRSTAKKILEKRKANGQPWHSQKTKEKIKKNNKAGTVEVRQKLREANLGKKNPEHSKRMALKTGLLNKNTRVFQLITPANVRIEIIGVAALREYSKSNELAFRQLFGNLNQGKIKYVVGKKPRATMTNCLGYELKEINRQT